MLIQYHKLPDDLKEIKNMPLPLIKTPLTGILKNNHDAIPQIVADCLVRQGVPGPCLGTRRPRQRLAFRGRLSSQNQLQGDENATIVDNVDDDDLPEEQNFDDKNTSLGSDTLAGIIFLYKIFLYHF